MQPIGSSETSSRNPLPFLRMRVRLERRKECRRPSQEIESLNIGIGRMSHYKKKRGVARYSRFRKIRTSSPHYYLC